MKVKKVLAATLAATMVMATGLTAFAGSGSASESAAAATVASEDAKSVVTANETVTVAGSTVKTTIAGCYAAKTVQGVAVITPAADLGLASGQKAYVTVYDTDAKKSNKAMESLNAAAQAVNGSVVATLNFDLFAKQGANKVALSNGSVQVTVGLPKTADTTKTYVVIRVVPGGEVTVLDNVSTNPKAVTFEVTAGQGTYAIVAK